MKPKLAGIILTLALMVLAAGCAYSGVNLVKTNRVTVDVVTAENISVTGVSVYQDKDVLVVRGKVNSLDLHKKRSGRMAISVLGPDGTLLKEAASDYSLNLVMHSPRRYPRLEAYEFFKEELPVVPPQGSTVRLVFNGVKNGL